MLNKSLPRLSMAILTFNVAKRSHAPIDINPATPLHKHCKQPRPLVCWIEEMSAYHLEALRRQRVVDRASEARTRLVEEQGPDKKVRPGKIVCFSKSVSHLAFV